MTNDKYKEFTKWVSKKAESLETMNLASVGMDLLIEFEEEQAKKQKEKEIKDTIEQALHEEHFYFAGTRLYANAIYNKLKEKDLIK